MSEVASDSQLSAGNPSHTITIQKAGLFLKATSALVGACEGIALRHLERRNDHEVELAVIIGKRANNVRAKDALNYVAGYSIGLDITIRGSEDRSFRKSPDSYMVLGPWLVTADEVPNPGELSLSIVLNGETKQDSNTRFMTLCVAELLPTQPRPPATPARWRYQEMRALLLEAGRLITAKEAERRVLILENPSMPGTSLVTQSIYAGLQLVDPGETTTTHRHVTSAL